MCILWRTHTPNHGGCIRAHWLSCVIELWMWRIWRWRLLNHPVSCWSERRCLWRGSKYPPERGWILKGKQVTNQNHQQHRVGIFWELFFSKSDTYFWAHNQPCWVFAVLTSLLKPKIHRVKLGACLTNVAERSARTFLLDCQNVNTVSYCWRLLMAVYLWVPIFLLARDCLQQLHETKTARVIY